MGLACGNKRMCACAPPRGKMLLYIALLDEGHGKSSHSVENLSGARLKRSLECRRREGETLTATLSLRALQIACLRSHKFPYRTLNRVWCANNEQPQKKRPLLEATPRAALPTVQYCSKTGAWPRIESAATRSEEHTSELQSLRHLVCRPLPEKKKKSMNTN